MKMQKIEMPTHKELFIKQMQEQILSGELTPGARIPSERELAEGMGVSRTVVNTGIATLVDQGFLRVQPRQGTFVADFKKEGTLKTLRAIIDLKGDVLTDAEIKTILEIRWALGQLTFPHAINNASDEEIKELETWLEKIRLAETPQEAAEASFEFQWHLSVMGKNDILTLIIVSFKPAVMTLWQRFVKKYGTDVLYQHTAKTYGYLCNRDLQGGLAWLKEFTDDSISGKFTVYNNQ